MSGRPGVWAAVLLVAAANTVPLAGWWWNRTGEPEAAIELTERETFVLRGGEQNTSTRLLLRLGDASRAEDGRRWIDSAALVALGFEPERVSESPPDALSARAPIRRPAWILLRVEDTPMAASAIEVSRLEPVAVGANPGELYRLSGDRGSHIVMKGVVGVRRGPRPRLPEGGPAGGETWYASVDLVSPRSLHVPRSLVPVLNRLAPPAVGADTSRYLIRLTMGRLHWPRVTGVFPRSH